MGINWNNVIKNQMRGMDPFSAYAKEEKRMRQERVKEYQEMIERNKACQQKQINNNKEEEKMVTKNVSNELEHAEKDRQGMEEKFGYKFSDNRIDIRGKDIVVEQGDCKMYMLPADDMRNYTVAYKNNTASSMRYGDMGETSLLNMTSSPVSACVVIEDNNKQIQAAAWVWVNEEKDLMVFDSIEFHHDLDAGRYMDIIREYVEAIPYQNIQMGICMATEIPFGQKCKEEDCISRPDNSHLNIEEAYCYSDYHASDRNMPLFLKKDGEILERRSDVSEDKDELDEEDVEKA